MASKETLRTRALVSAAASSYLRGPNSLLSDRNYFHVNDSGEVAILPAAANESIAIAFHRMDKVQERYVVLATLFDDKGSLLEFDCHVTPDNISKDVIDVPAHMTVQEWFEAYGDGSSESSFTCSGEEFGFEISSLASGFALQA